MSKHYSLHYGRSNLPLTKFDVIIARICLFAVGFCVLAVFAFVTLLFIIL
ncbi:hypothetical protein [Butyrivibrio sp. AE3006]|nr:hypothetical protein [Butyrivibrio sp. AE3006]